MSDISKIQLITNVECYGPAPEPNEEVEQRLTMNKDGKVLFSSYNFGEGEYVLKTRTIKSVDKEKVDCFLNHIQKYFANNKVDLFITDVGEWSLNITYLNGEITQYIGSVGQGNMIDGIDLSDELRKLMDNKNLFAFDGNWEN